MLATTTRMTWVAIDRGDHGDEDDDAGDDDDGDNDHDGDDNDDDYTMLGQVETCRVVPCCVVPGPCHGEPSS